jgi:hypothetical protein
VTWALDEGSDFAGWTWRNSALVAWARDDGARRDAAHTIYTNWPAAIWFQTGRASRELPDTTDPAVLAAFRDGFLRRHGALIGFSAPNVDVVPPDSLAARLGLVPALRAADGTVWVAPAPELPPVEPARVAPGSPAPPRRGSGRRAQRHT